MSHLKFFILIATLTTNNGKNKCLIKNIGYLRVFKFSILTTNNAIYFFHPNLFRIYLKKISIILSFFSYSLGENKFV